MLRVIGIALALTLWCAGVQAQSGGVKCGTERAFAKEGKAPLDIPNILRDSLRSPSGRFLIHYDAAASTPDSVTSPEYAGQAARLADSAYDFEIGVLGYTPPPYSSSDHYDIFLTPKPFGAYGATVPVSGGDLGASPSGLQLTRSYVVADNRFSDPIYATKGYDALRITIFHEFFHVVQFGSYGHTSSNTYFQEMSSVWMEMLSTPGVLDWLTPGPLGAGAYFRTLDLSWYQSPAGGYGQGIYLKYLDTLYTPTIVRETWSYLSTTESNPLSAVNAVLAQHGSSFCQAYLGFGVQAFQSGRRLSRQNLLPSPGKLPTDSLPVVLLDSTITQFTALPASLQFFARGFGADTCAVIVSRTTDRSIVSGDVRMPLEGQSLLNVSDPASICDTTFCLAPPALVASVSPNPVGQDYTGPIYFVVRRGGTQPASVLLDVFTVTMVPLAHIEGPTEAYGATYRMPWRTRDDAGRDLPSGEYVYALTVDGQRSIGKFVIVR